MRSAELGFLQVKPCLRIWSATMVASLLWFLAAAVPTGPARQTSVRTPVVMDETNNGPGLRFIAVFPGGYRGVLVPRRWPGDADLAEAPLVAARSKPGRLSKGRRERTGFAVT